MEKILYIDCFSGVNENMILGAFLELGISQQILEAELEKLDIVGWQLQVEQIKRNGIYGTYAEININSNASKEKEHNCEKKTCDSEQDIQKRKEQNIVIYKNKMITYTEMIKLISKSRLTESVKKTIDRILNQLAKMDAKVQNQCIEEIKISPDDAIKTIFYIAAVVICVDYLKPDSIYASNMRDGYGFVKYQGNSVPVPMPIVTQLLTEKNISLQQLEVEQALITPIGAVIITELATMFGAMPEIKLENISYGIRKEELPIPNVLRVILGTAERHSTMHLSESSKSFKSFLQDNIIVMETNIDDCSPEILAYTIEKLFEKGALDVYYTSIGMKKNRQGIRLTILCKEEQKERLEEIVFSETTTIGIRYHEEKRDILNRQIKEIATKYGIVKVKEVSYYPKKENTHKVKKVYPEYESAKKIAEKNGVSLQTIYNEIIRNL